MSTPSNPLPQSSTPAWVRWLASTALRDVGFWSTLVVLIVVVFMIPQIHNIILQTVETGTNVFGAATLLSAGFLAFLSLLAAAAFASILYVVPPSFRSQEGQGAKPIHLVKESVWIRASKLALLVVLLIAGVIARIPHMILIVVATILVFADVRRFVARRSGWLVKVTERTVSPLRRAVGFVLVVIALMILCTFGARGESSRFYRLAGSACQEFGLLSLLVGGWLLLIPSGISRENALGSIRTAQGRLLGWLVGSYLGGEILWILAGGSLTQAWFSYRLYTIWAVLELLVLCVIIASLMDTWQTALQLPMRLAGLLVAGLLFFATGTPFREIMHPLKLVAGAQKQLPENWPALLQRRIANVPTDDPVVLVASSGGGSRAAIFSTLILEHLARETFPQSPNTTWADHIILISGVSGGSLGAARFLQANDSGKWIEDAVPHGLRFSVRDDLLTRMARTAHELPASLDQKADRGFDVEQKLRDTVDEVMGLCDDLLASEPRAATPVWLTKSKVVDDMCADFMAPVLRGALTPNLSRGESLRHFWSEQFGWIGRTDRNWPPQSAGASDPVPPLAIYNTTNIRRGTRVALGFPPLPRGFLQLSKANNPALAYELRHWSQTLADIDKDRVADLSQAVALSANFPFGFNVRSIRRDPKLVKKDEDPYVDLLDGGVVDNTGIDTLFLVFQSIKTCANKFRAGEWEDADEKKLNAHCAALWQELNRRGVILVEIDSGAKPTETPDAFSRLLSVALDPIAGLTNAAYTNADSDRLQYFESLGNSFHVAGQELLLDKIAELECGVDSAGKSSEKDQLGSRLDALEREVNVDGGGAFGRQTFMCNHWGDPNVITAWSLGPEDKASTFVQFLIERQSSSKRLNELATNLRAERDKRRQKIEGELAELGQESLKLLVTQLSTTTGAVKNHILEGTRDPAKAKGQLNELQNQLQQVEALSQTIPAAATPELNATVKQLQGAITESRDYLAQKQGTKSAKDVQASFPTDSLSKLATSGFGISSQRQRNQSLEAAWQASKAVLRDKQQEINQEIEQKREMFDRFKGKSQDDD